ncbi:hypothetical protein RAM_00895 [Amycolatopsis mediterranei S699]|uniref:Uncharacterized protein n=1 Tax=Amycolatopsis mediterranei (strain S699) TaxID=713604 RepID=A0A9R0NQB1_AMYMS|nr:hypothetical protein RAM_00895 [Amycolatopsis mediterranei S699]
MAKPPARGAAPVQHREPVAVALARVPPKLGGEAPRRTTELGHRDAWRAHDVPVHV